MRITTNPMIKERKNQNISCKAFTLIEMIIVLIIMGILLMVTIYLSWDQIQKVKDKTVKESILAEMQSRYSRNLWSSSFGWTMYDTMSVNIKNGDNKFDFNYTYWNDLRQENTFSDNFEIKYIVTNYNFAWNPWQTENEIKLEYNPYKIWCKVWNNNDSVTIIARVNDHKNYCFDINKNNCRLVEVSSEKCETLAELTHIDK